MNGSPHWALGFSGWMTGGADTIVVEPVAELEALGFHAFTTTRESGSFNTMAGEPSADVFSRWYRLVDYVGRWVPRFATAPQVHGTTVHRHEGTWTGWLRTPHGDGHFAPLPGTAMAVTVADCVPVFVAHPSGAAAMLHAGWRGTAGGILERGVTLFAEAGHEPSELVVHLGPSICGKCYEVGPEVYRELTGNEVDRPTCADLRAILASQAESLGVRQISISRWCTRCHNDRFYSHRCGDKGRQLGVILRAAS